MSTPEPIARITPTTRYSGGCDKLEGAEVGIKDGGGDMSGSVAGVRYWRIGSGNIDIREQIEILPLMRRLWETSVAISRSSEHWGPHDKNEYTRRTLHSTRIRKSQSDSAESHQSVWMRGLPQGPLWL